MSTAARPTPQRTWSSVQRRLDLIVIFVLVAIYWASFDRTSPPFRDEVFGQDTKHILRYLSAGRMYIWNPQNHLLYHVLVEWGYGLWTTPFGSGIESAYRYLKLFTALTGLGYLMALRGLLRDLGLRSSRRTILLALAGVSVSSWFHFAVFETHCLAMPALALYLATLVRLRRGGPRRPRDRVLFVGALVTASLTRVDLWRFALVSLALPLLPSLRRHWRTLAADLAAVALLGVLASTFFARAYFGDVSLKRASSVTFIRWDRPELRRKMRRFENVRPAELLTVGRAISLYTFAMPVTSQAEADPARAVPRHFREPLATVMGHPIALMTMGTVVAGLFWALIVNVWWAARSDPLASMLVLQWGAGWLFYTWFNPWEPFLWGLEFHLVSVVAIANAARSSPPPVWSALAVGAALLAVHNFVYFYLLFS